MVKIYRFTASWCNPCKALAEVLKNENIVIPNVIDVDTPEAKPLMEHYGIRSVPTIVIDTGNGDFERIVGGSLSNLHKEALRGYLNT